MIDTIDIEDDVTTVRFRLNHLVLGCKAVDIKYGGRLTKLKSKNRVFDDWSR